MSNASLVNNGQNFTFSKPTQLQNYNPFGGDVSKAKSVFSSDLAIARTNSQSNKSGGKTNSIFCVG